MPRDKYADIVSIKLCRDEISTIAWKFAWSYGENVVRAERNEGRAKTHPSVRIDWAASAERARKAAAEDLEIVALMVPGKKDRDRMIETAVKQSREFAAEDEKTRA